MTTIQLNPPIWVATTKGIGYAILMTDYGPDWDRLWTVVIRETGEVWDFRTPDIRAKENKTLAVNQRNEDDRLVFSLKELRRRDELPASDPAALSQEFMRSFMRLSDDYVTAPH